MSKSLNKVTLIGRLGKDPELRTTQSGKSVVNFSVATDRGVGENSVTDWHNITMWEKLADIAAEYLHKGDRVYIEGQLHYNSREDDAGIKRTYTSINASQMIMLQGKEQQQAIYPSTKSSKGKQIAQTSYDLDDDIPF